MKIHFFLYPHPHMTPPHLDNDIHMIYFYLASSLIHTRVLSHFIIDISSIWEYTLTRSENKFITWRYGEAWPKVSIRQKEAQNELTHQIWAKSNRRFVCKCAKTTRSIRHQKTMRIEWSVIKVEEREIHWSWDKMADILHVLEWICLHGGQLTPRQYYYITVTS